MKHNRLRRSAVALTALLVCVWVVGCNRAAARIPGASLSFPATSTNYVATQTYPYTVVVAMPIDQRGDHYGERVAGTRWTGCRTDPFWATDAASVIRDRLTTELRTSHLFAQVSQEPPTPGDVVLRTEIDAFCSQAVGFIYGRIAGISALKITAERDGQPLFEHKFERVVTDADAEYTGLQIAFIEQAMEVTMADSLRELLRDFLTQLDHAAGSWQVPSSKSS